MASEKKELAKLILSNFEKELQATFSLCENLSLAKREFEEKIIYPETTQGAYFVLDNQGMFLEKTAFFIAGKNLKYLSAILNSNTITFFFKNFSQGCLLGNGAYQYNKHALEKLPIPKINSKNQKLADELINLTDEILKIKEQDKKADIKELEDKIDRLVYKLYELNNDEIKIIQGE